MLFSAGLASILLLAGATYAEVAHVILPDLTKSQVSPRAVSPSDARLVFAQRLGLEEFHSLQNANEATIESLNLLGAKPEPLFSGKSLAEPQQSAIIVVEGADDIFDLGVTTKFTTFDIENAPSPSVNRKLLAAFAQQRRYLTPEVSDTSLRSNIINNFGVEKKHLFTVGDRDVFAQYSGLELAKKQYGQSSSEYRETIVAVRQALSALIEEYNIIIVLMPSRQSVGLFKRAESYYGTFEVLPSKRQIASDPATDANAGLLSEFIHEALEEIVEMEQALEGAIFIASNSSHSNSTSPSKGNSTVTPPRGILPACYSSQSACESRTHSCSGHGSCKLAYSYGSGDKVNCYACACTPSVRTNKDGTKKTTVWAGPACQKKDVSMPFWLLGGFSIFLISVVIWGVGLLYAMGQEELPSVIGAGVAGPRAKQ